MPSKLVNKSSTLDTVFLKGNMQQCQQKLLYNGWILQEANQVMLHKEITGYLKCVTHGVHNSPGTESSRLFVGKIQVPRNGNLKSFKAPDWTWQSLSLSKDRELGSLCSFISASEKALDWLSSQQGWEIMKAHKLLAKKQKSRYKRVLSIGHWNNTWNRSKALEFRAAEN